jgi:A/G-specific adenine glycosylase
VRPHCAAATSADPERFPAPRKRALPKAVAAAAGLLESGAAGPGRRVLLARRPRGGLLGGLWELPSEDGADAASLPASLERRTGLRTRAAEKLGELEHGFSHRQLTLHVFRLELVSPRSTRIRSGGRDEARWFSRSELHEIGHSRLMTKALRVAGLL